MSVKRLSVIAGFVAILLGPAPLLSSGDAGAQRYIARCVATPYCRITCTSNRYTVACFARVQYGRCYKRCVRVR